MGKRVLRTKVMLILTLFGYCGGRREDIVIFRRR